MSLENLIKEALVSENININVDWRRYIKLFLFFLEFSFDFCFFGLSFDFVFRFDRINNSHEFVTFQNICFGVFAFLFFFYFWDDMLYVLFFISNCVWQFETHHTN